MKKIISMSIITALTLSLLAGCSEQAETIINEEEKINIVCTSYSVYDWVREISGDNVDVTYLLENGLDLHNYTPSVADVVKIQESDLFIYVGGHSDVWADEFVTDDVNAISLVEILNDRVMMEGSNNSFGETAEICEEHGEDCDGNHDDHEHDDEICEEHGEDCDGNHDDHDHDDEICEEHGEDCDGNHDDHDHDDEICEEHGEDCDGNHDDHEHDDEICEEHGEDCDGNHDEHSHSHEDEHVWMSLQNAIICVKEISENIINLDASNEENYVTATNDYVGQLNELHLEYLLETANAKPVMVADRFPLLYMFNDYNLDYYAAFSGCSTKFDVSFSTIKFLMDKTEEHDIETLVTLTGSEGAIAHTICENLEKEIPVVEINTMEAVNDMSKSYIDIMRENLESLKIAVK